MVLAKKKQALKACLCGLWVVVCYKIKIGKCGFRRFFEPVFCQKKTKKQ